MFKEMWLTLGCHRDMLLILSLKGELLQMPGHDIGANVSSEHICTMDQHVRQTLEQLNDVDFEGKFYAVILCKTRCVSTLVVEMALMFSFAYFLCGFS